MRQEIIPNMFADTARPSTPPRMQRSLSAIAAITVSLGCLFFASSVFAIGLSNATTNSRIGAPLRVEIPMQSDDIDRIELACIRLVGAPPGYSDDIPWLTVGNLNFEQGPQGRLLVITARASNHPAIMVGLRVECGVGLRRDYALLLNPPSSAEVLSLPASSPPVSAKPAPVEPPRQASANTSTNAWQVQAGDSARNIADRLIPGNRDAQRKFAHAILAQNADKLGGATATRTRNTLPVGINLALPALPESKPARSAERVAATIQPSSPAIARPTPRSPTPAKSNAPRDRLLVTEGGGNESSLRMATAIGQRKELGEDQRARLRTEMQLIATLDDKIATQIELSERLRQLEAMQESLKQDATRLEGALQAARAQQSPAQDSNSPLAIQTLPPATTSPPQASAHQPEPQSPWYASNIFILGALLTVAAGLSAALWVGRCRSKRIADTEVPLALDQVSGGAGGVADHLIEPLSEADIWPDEEGHAPKTSALRTTSPIQGALGHFTASGLGPASLLQIVDDDVEEHDSAIELAEIMMSFGRVHGAAQTLADFIRSNPKQAVKPWIKLLEVYRVADMRAEFDALSMQLNKTFNIKTVEWDSFELARQTPESLEDMPHILTKLSALWGKRECQTYLHGLLRDNRQGTRQGFPLAIVDDILMLLGVLERQLGAYRPDLAESNANTAPHTIATATLNIPPIVTTEAPVPENPPTLSYPTIPTPTKPLPDSARTTAPAAAIATASQPQTASNLQQLDFELDMTDLSKTLHLNLDDLDEDGSFMKDTDSI